MGVLVEVSVTETVGCCVFSGGRAAGLPDSDGDVDVREVPAVLGSLPDSGSRGAVGRLMSASGLGVPVSLGRMGFFGAILFVLDTR